MAGFSPKIPLIKSSIDGFAITKSLQDLIKQNFKMLILTSPGERVMEPEFGVGIRNFLFEPLRDSTYGSIQNRINEQVQKYMPFIDVVNVSFSSMTNSPADFLDYDENYLGIEIVYDITTLGVTEVLDILV